MADNPHPVASTPPALPQLLDAVGALVFAKDLQGRFHYANAPLLQALGLSAEQLLGTTAADHLDSEQAQTVVEQEQRVLQQGVAVNSEERWMRPGETRARIYWVVREPLWDAQRRVCGLCCVATDITERKAIEAQLQEQRQLLDVVLNSLDAYVYMKDEHRRYRYINDKVARDWGKRPHEVVGKLDREVLPAELADRFWAMDASVFSSGQAQAAEEVHLGPDGSLRHHWSIKVPVRYEGVPTLIGMSTDISELVRLREQLRLQASTDGLTGLANRRHFEDIARKELARARRDQLHTALLLLDLDHFKRINDCFGHPCGDAVLCRLAELLRAQLRQEDSAARIGGEEFALLLPRTALEPAQAFAERLRCAVRELRGLLPDDSRLSCSLGLVVDTHGQESLEALVSRADAALYQAKREGRDRVVVAD